MDVRYVSGDDAGRKGVIGTQPPHGKLARRASVGRIVTIVRLSFTDWILRFNTSSSAATWYYIVNAATLLKFLLNPDKETACIR
jgi:hypothetical protein